MYIYNMHIHISSFDNITWSCHIVSSHSITSL
jgi:hypothetical protein